MEKQPNAKPGERVTIAERSDSPECCGFRCRALECPVHGVGSWLGPTQVCPLLPLPVQSFPQTVRAD